MSIPKSRFALITLVLSALACSLPLAVRGASTQPAQETQGLPSTDGNAVPASQGSSTPPPLVATINASQHAAVPADVTAAGKLYYDVDSTGTAPEHRAPYGDSYNINLFERPFTQTDMNYLPQLDLLTFQLGEDDTWYYASLDLSGGDPNDESGVNYGIELDIDHDGFGDYLIWTYWPYTTQWLAETVQVYQDTNHDTGGASAEKSDAPFPGDGYDKLVFDHGQGADPDLAWVRLNPHVSAGIQIAFKKMLAGSSFMWGAWADSGLKDPSKFNYNDRFTEEEAGSPEKSEKYYPIKAIYEVDNTCWAAVGFKPTGYEPHLCPSLEPQPTKRKPAPTAGPECPPGQFCPPPGWNPPALCLPRDTLIDTPNGQVLVNRLEHGDSVWTVDSHGARVATGVLQTSRVAVDLGHVLIDVHLSDGRAVRASPGHPTADGRTFGTLRLGEPLDGATVVSLTEQFSTEPYTYDLLPGGPTGFYWANGVLIGSTLSR
jgi:hypothetical protein